MSVFEREWRVVREDGKEEVFTSEGAALARAWVLTPAGGERPAVQTRLTEKSREQVLSALDEALEVYDDMFRKMGVAAREASKSFKGLEAKLAEFAAKVVKEVPRT